MSNGLRVGKLAIASLLLATFLASADESFVLTTGSDVASALNASSFAAWLVAGYNLGYILALPMYGEICEKTGPKNAILLALTVYSIGCLMTGLSRDIYWAVAGRLTAGFGGAGMNELVSVILNDAHDFDRVAMLRSYVTTISIIGNTCGAPLGAFLTSWIGWQWAFLIHVPLALLCLALSSLTLAPKKAPSFAVSESIYGTIESCKAENLKCRSLDILGLISLLVSVTCLLAFVQLTQGQAQENKPVLLIICAVTFLVCSAVFYLNETRWAQDPIIPFSLLSPQTFGLIYGAQLFIGIAQFSMTPILGDYWVSTRGLSASEGAMCCIPSAIGFACGSLATGKIIQKTHKCIRWTIIGLIIAMSSFALMLVRWTLYRPELWELAYTFSGWVGMGMVLSSQFARLAAAKPEQNAAASVTTYYFAQQIGLMTGISTAKSLIMKEMRRRLNIALRDQRGSSELIDQIMSNRQSTALLPPVLREIVRTVVQKSYIMSPATSLVSLLIAFFLVLNQNEVMSVGSY